MTIEIRSGRWLVVALIASLAVNLFLGGYLAGRWLHRAPFGWSERHAASDRVDRIMEAVLGRMTNRLEAAEREVFRKAIDGHRPDLREASAATSEARRALRRALGGEKYDPARLTAAFAEVRARNLAFYEALERAITDAIQRLPADARAQLGG